MAGLVSAGSDDRPEKPKGTTASSDDSEGSERASVSVDTVLLDQRNVVCRSKRGPVWYRSATKEPQVKSPVTLFELKFICSMQAGSLDRDSGVC